MMKKIDPRYWRFLGLLVMLTLVSGLPTYSQPLEEFIPADSFFYLKLENLATCREAIEHSESWQTASDIISTAPKWQSVNEFMQMLPMFLGTDVQGVIETFLDDKIALTVSPGTNELMIGIVIQTTSKTQDAEQIFSTLTRTLASMGTEVSHSQGDYRDTQYHTLQLNQQQFTYGSIGDFFLIGSSPSSFKKMVDIYEKQNASITSNATYLSVTETQPNSEVFAFIDVSKAFPYLIPLLPPTVVGELEAFEALVYSWDLLKPGGGPRLFGQLKGGTQTSLISSLMTETALKTTQGFSGTEDFLVALSPSSASLVWQGILGWQVSTSDIQHFLFPSPEKVQAALTGEFSLGIDFTNILSHLSRLYTLDVNRTQGGIDTIKVNFPQLDVGWVFKPDAPEELQTIFNGILEKFSVKTRRKINYKGISLNTTSIPGTLYYANYGDLFLLAFSEKQFQRMVDNLLAKTPTGNLQERLTLIEALPSGVFQLNLDPLITIIGSANPGIPPDATAFATQMESLLAAFFVEKETAWVEIRHAPHEKGIEAVAKLAPFLFLNIIEGTKF